MRPTDAQLELLYRWFNWKMPTPKAKDAVEWLGKHSTKREVSNEIKRVGDLWHSHKLNEELCFDSPVWNDYLLKGAKV